MAAACSTTHDLGMGGLYYLNLLHVCNGFDYVMIGVDHMSTRMACFMPCTKEITSKEIANVFQLGVYRSHGNHQIMLSSREFKLVSIFWRTFWRRMHRHQNEYAI
jgi:hypothetical protein